MTDTVDTDNLRALVEQWREFAEGHTGAAYSAYNQCADELEELIE